MKSWGIAFLAISFFAISVTDSSAQVSPAGITPFTYSQSTPSSDTSGSFGMFGSLLQSESSLFAPRLFGAWSPNSSSIRLSATANAYEDANNSGSGEGILEWSTNGVWLGLSLPMQINRLLSLDVQGWYFFPNNKHVEISGQATGVMNGQFGSESVSGNLDIQTTWFAIDIEGSVRVSSEFSILAGVRYDYLQGTITAPDPLEALLLSQFPGLRAKLDVNLNSIFPYLGAKYSISTGQGSITFALKGFPCAISVAEVHPTSGYFGEVFCSYEVSPKKDFSLSLFAKADAAHAVFEECSQVANIFNRDPSVQQNTRVDQSLPVTWQQYMIGGVGTLNFGLPFL